MLRDEQTLKVRWEADVTVFVLIGPEFTLRRSIKPPFTKKFIISIIDQLQHYYKDYMFPYRYGQPVRKVNSC